MLGFEDFGIPKTMEKIRLYKGGKEQEIIFLPELIWPQYKQNP